MKRRRGGLGPGAGRMGADESRADRRRGFERCGRSGAGFEYGGVPAAMLATPWTHEPAETNGNPTNDPEAGSHEGEEQMQGMIDRGPGEDLLVAAPWAVCANFILGFSHLGLPRRRNPSRVST